MPELPDVEGFRRVARRAGRHPVTRVDVLDASVLRGVTATGLRKAVVRRALAKPRRHGKWLGVPTRAPSRRHRRDEPVVTFHFGMTGSLHWCSHGEPRHRHDRLVFVTEHGELRFRDMRKLHGVGLAGDDREFAHLLEGLGPDAAAVSADDLANLLGDRRAGIKSVLIDQSVLAGLGNLTVDETLWRARTNPTQPARELTAADRRRLLRAMHSVLDQSTKAGVVPDRPSWLTGQRDSRSGECPRCGSRLRRTRVSGRSTVWCPRCQPG